MADLSLSLPFTLKHEGGWSDDVDDPGGATNFGITLATAQRHGIMDADALRAITPQQVEAIYRADYWHYNGLVSQAISTKLFDIGVNCSPRVAVRLIQDALNGLGADLREDGVWGPATEGAANAASPGRLMDALCREAAEHYQAIVAARPASAKFLRGWLRRAAEVPHG